MTRITIDIPAGVVTDDTSFASSGAWVNADKIRFWRGRAEVIGGWERFLVNPLMGVCRTILPWTDNDGVLNVAFGLHNGLQVSSGGDLHDITPAAFVEGAINGTGGDGYGTGYYGLSLYGQPTNTDTFPLTWSLATYGQSLMANPRGQTIFWWQNDTSQLAEPLANAPAEVAYMLVTQSRQVMAFGCSEEVSGDFNAMCIRFSDIENPDVWNTALDNNAGEVILEGGSRIVAARIIGSYIYVWTDFALFMGVFTGNSDQPWAFEKLGENCGLIGPNAAIVKDQVAYWMGPDVQFRQCGLGGAPSLIVSPLQQELQDNMPIIQADKVVASSCSEYGEVRFDYPDSREDPVMISVPIVLIGLDGGVLLGPDGAVLIAGYEQVSSALEGAQLLGEDQFELVGEDGFNLVGEYELGNDGSENSRYVVVSTVDGSWSKGRMSRTAYVDAQPQQYPLAVSDKGYVYIHERGNSADGGVIDWSLESADLYLGEAADPMLMVKEVWPDFKNQLGYVSLTIYVKKYPHSNYYQHGPYQLPVGRVKRDFRATGRIAKFVLSSNTTPTYMRLGKLVFDIVPTGLQ